MYKKVISVGMSFLMLFEFSTVNVFAKGGDEDFNSVENRNTEKERYSDYCENAPKNECGKTADVGCVIENELPNFKEGNEPTLIKDGVGVKCETDVYMWKYTGLNRLAKQFEDWINNAKMRAIKGEFFADFIKAINRFFSLNSEKDSEEIISKWVKTSNYSKLLNITKKDFDDWAIKMRAKKKDTEGDEKSRYWGGGMGAAAGASAGWGIHGILAAKAAAAAAVKAAAAVGVEGGAALVAEAAAAAAGAIPLAPFVIIGGLALGGGGVFLGNHYGKKKKMDKKAYENSKKAEKQKRKWNVYSRAVENIFEAINNNEWVGNDLLLAELNYGKDSPCAMINFVKAGVDVPENVNAVFRNLSLALSNLKENLTNEQANRKNNKEEL